MPPRPIRGTGATADENVTIAGIRHHLEILASGRSDHDDVVYRRMDREGMGGANCGVTVDEDANPHEGSTGCQFESGSTFWPDPLSRTAATAATAAMMRTGESRFTRSVYGLGGLRLTGAARRRPRR